MTDVPELDQAVYELGRFGKADYLDHEGWSRALERYRRAVLSDLSQRIYAAADAYRETTARHEHYREIAELVRLEAQGS